MNNDLDIQKALSDIAVIRRALNQTEQRQMDARLVGVTLDANVLLQGIAFLAALSLCGIEVFSNYSITQALTMGSQSRELSLVGIGIMASVLIGLVITLYYVLWRAAKHNAEDMTAYITRNFAYVKNLSFISDLLIKFMTLALLMLAGHGEWIAPVLLAFTGDYLLQGRFFTLPTKSSIALGVICLALAVAQFLTNSATVLLPLVVFTVVAGISSIKLATRYQQDKA